MALYLRGFQILILSCVSLALLNSSPSAVWAQDAYGSVEQIDDRQAPLQDPFIFVFTSGEDFITVRPGDRAIEIVRFSEGTFDTVIGQDGEGPCEQMDVTAMDVRADTLFSLDAHQGRILLHDLSSGDCLTSYANSDLRFMNGISVGRSGVYLTYGQFSSRTPSDTPLFYRFDREAGEIIPKDGPTVDDVNHALLPIAVNAPLPMHRTEYAIWFTLTGTGQVFSFDKAAQAPERFPAEVAFPDLDGYDLSSPDDLAELVDSDVPFIEEMHVLSSGELVLAVRKGAVGEQQVRIYSAEGDLRAEKDFSADTRIVNIDDDELTFLLVKEDPDQPYALGRKALVDITERD